MFTQNARVKLIYNKPFPDPKNATFKIDIDIHVLTSSASKVNKKGVLLPQLDGKRAVLTLETILICWYRSNNKISKHHHNIMIKVRSNTFISQATIQYLLFFVPSEIEVI